jgi:biotin transport system ATP-binding protein
MGAGEALLAIRKVSKVFPASSDGEVYRALNGIDLAIYEGQSLLIAGSNGSGKTLLMRIIAGLTDPTEGEIRCRGKLLWSDASARPDKSALQSLRGELGLVFQDADSQIVGETVEEDIAFGPENMGLSPAEIQQRLDFSLAAMGLAHKRGSPPRRLSGGEKRRLAVAGILAMGCDTVIMDEPFANLDWPGVVQTLRVIQDLKAAGKTLIILTHELEKALAFADRLVILHRGEIRADGESAAVLDRLDPAWGVRDPRRNYASVEDCTWLDT